MNRTASILAAGLAGLACAAPAQAASRFTVDGAGYGHGIGMSQWGALGFAEHGRSYRQILSHYYSNTELRQIPSRKVVRVLIQSPSAASFTGASRADKRKLDPSRRYVVVRHGSSRVELRSERGKRLGRYAAPLVVRGRRLSLDRAGRYRGRFEFRPGTFSGVNAINAVGLEEYVRGVISAEMPSKWPAEALRAQAVAARTYAMTTSKNGAGFDQYPDTRSQVYRGIAAETAATDAAVADTRGELVTQDGRPVVTYFFSTSGGHTENLEFSFLGSKPATWLKGVEDPYDDGSPKHRWKLTMSLRSAERKLGRLVKGRFRGIKVLERGVSPRVVEAEVIGSDGRVRTTGPELRRRLGLFDTWARFTTVTAEASEPSDDGDADRTDAPASDPSGGVAPPPGRAAHARTATLRGRAVPGRAGDRILIQRRLHGPWQTVGESRLLRGGRYRVQVLAPGRYRIMIRGVPGPAIGF